MAMVNVDRVRPHVSVITLNNSDRLNSMSFALVGDLYDAIAEVGADNDCWVAVITGAGRGFCSGLDLMDTSMAPGMAARMCELSPYGVQLTKQVLWANLEAGSLRAAIDVENRNQLMAGHTGNLEEAKAAFREKRRPKYEE